jgi:hypothetical protein
MQHLLGIRGARDQVNCRETVDLYRRGSGIYRWIYVGPLSGALSIELFEGSRWRSARGALLMGILSPQLIEEAVLDGSYLGRYDDASGKKWHDTA